ncbi:hypothetical protein PV327_007457 [Microctonus hyperodae]|uniref:Uncharacterized protein n=1 Tax=Microctonus hyperodae TaxID=165561 RepID=A0AA39G0I7_MICHY|nr:hypothetical protein PV327_007457 [Microctonus hyperodae]
MSLVQWNVAGIKNVRETWPFLEKYSIARDLDCNVILQETWVEKGNSKREIEKMSKKFEWRAVDDTRECMDEGATVKYKKGKAKGRQMIGIKYEICNEWDMEEWECGMIIKCNKVNKEKNKKKSFCNNYGKNDCKSICFVTVYNNIGIARLENYLKCCVNNLVHVYKDVYVMRDLNARTGKERGGEIEEGGGECRARASQEKMINEEGK